MMTPQTLDETATGASIGITTPTTSHTRTISELVERVGFLNRRTKLLVEDSNDVHSSTDELHSATLEQLLRQTARRHASTPLPDLLNELSTLGFSWRELAQLASVSVPALRKWRLGEPATGGNRRRVTEVLAFCEIIREKYLVNDPVAWLEFPLHTDAPLTPRDLIAHGRFDLAFKLAWDDRSDPESVLDQFEPEWRDNYKSRVEVFVAEDGLPGLRPREATG